MSTDNKDIFGSNQEATPPQETSENQSQTSPLDDLLREIKGEDGRQKYNSVEDALKGQVHAQKKIQELKEEQKRKEAEVSELQEAKDRLAALEDTIAQLTQQKREEPTGSKPISEEDIQKQVSIAMQQHRTKEVSEKNTQEVVTMLGQQFGDKASEVFYSKGKDLGFTAEEMNALAASKPKAVFTMLGITDSAAHKQAPVNPNTTSLNTAGMKPKTDTFIRRNDKRLPIGATNAELMDQAQLAHNMVLELQERGMSVRDLTDPKVYQKIFK